MEGLTASELGMIKRLAGNKGVIRKKTMKKMKTWLTAIFSRVPDTPDCRTLIENNFLRVWKALFYCMWMADKPLPQEELAEQISDLANIFASKPVVFNLFTEWFFRTMAREWPHIDRFRMDKFMMLVRRFLRKTLAVIADQNWKLDVLDGFLRMVSTNIFNRRSEIKNTRSKARDPAVEVAPVGLQIHFIDIFLEELAKVGGQTMKSQKILKVLSPFIQELTLNDDERVLAEIVERIFYTLMRQSDAGIDYSEGVTFNVMDEEDEDIESVAQNQMQNGDVESDEEEDNIINATGLDPRAGAQDVILPQLGIDYQDLSNKLVEVGGQKSVRIKNRKLLYSLATKFKTLSEGNYPLTIATDVPSGPAIKRKDVEKAARRLVNLDSPSPATKAAKARKPKKVRNRMGKQKEATNNSQEDVNSESDTSFYLRDDELLDHVSDNYMSYLEELHQKDAGQINGNLEASHSESGEDEDKDDNNVDTGLTTPKKANARKKDGSPGTPNKKKTAERLSKSPTITSVLNTKKRRASVGPVLNGIQESLAKPSNSNEVTPVKARKKGYTTVVEVEEDPDDDVTEKDTYLTVGANKMKKRKLDVSLKVDSPATPGSTKRKRVSFVLARNLQHEHSDYANSITRSPSIPFDSSKQPGQGLLKSPAPSPVQSMFARLASTPRRKSVLF